MGRMARTMMGIDLFYYIILLMDDKYSIIADNH